MDSRDFEFNRGSNKEYPGEYRNNNDVMTVGEWVITLIVLAIPIVNIAMYFIWAFGNGVNKNKQNFCKATLLMAGISLIVTILLLAIGFTY